MHITILIVRGVDGVNPYKIIFKNFVYLCISGAFYWAICVCLLQPGTLRRYCTCGMHAIQQLTANSYCVLGDHKYSTILQID